MRTLEEIYELCSHRLGPEYAEKQIHRFPEPMPVVCRETFLLERTRGKVVLDIGASGPMSEAIRQAASKWYGIDRPGSSDVMGVVGIDLDDTPEDLPIWDDVEVIVCGEVLEHLSNPGRFLDALFEGYSDDNGRCVSLIVTVPNANALVGQRSVARGYENCNKDHVAWHSPRTIRTLLERAGYEPKEWAWYNGNPGTAEGIIVVAE